MVADLSARNSTRGWLRLDLERENLLGAHAWCDHVPNGAALGLRLVSAIRPYWMNRGLLGLGHRITVEALSRAGAQERTPARCRGLFEAGQLAYFMGRYAEAQALLSDSVAIARELGDEGRVAAALQTLGMAAMGQGDLSAARRHLEEALALQRSRGDKRRVAAALNALGQLHRVEGALDRAEPLYREGLSLVSELGDRGGIAVVLLNLAMLGISRKTTKAPAKMLLDVIRIAQDVGSTPAGQSALEVSASLAALCKDWESAVRFYAAAEAQAVRTGLHRDPADHAFLAPFTASAKDNLDPHTYVAADAEGSTMPYADAIEAARCWLERHQ